jgi:hypothetical protein
MSDLATINKRAQEIVEMLRTKLAAEGAATTATHGAADPSAAETGDGKPPAAAPVTLTTVEQEIVAGALVKGTNSPDDAADWIEKVRGLSFVVKDAVPYAQAENGDLIGLDADGLGKILPAPLVAPVGARGSGGRGGKVVIGGFAGPDRRPILERWEAAKTKDDPTGYRFFVQHRDEIHKAKRGSNVD